MPTPASSTAPAANLGPPQEWSGVWPRNRRSGGGDFSRGEGAGPCLLYAREAQIYHLTPARNKVPSRRGPNQFGSPDPPTLGLSTPRQTNGSRSSRQRARRESSIPRTPLAIASLPAFRMSYRSGLAVETVAVDRLRVSGKVGTRGGSQVGDRLCTKPNTVSTSTRVRQRQTLSRQAIPPGFTGVSSPAETSAGSRPLDSLPKAHSHPASFATKAPR